MTQKTNINKPLVTAIFLILIAGASRLINIPGIGQYQNFTAMGGLTIFAASYFRPFYKGVIISFIAYLISDLFINAFVYNGKYGIFHWGSFIQYGSMALVALIGYFGTKKVSLLNIFSSSILGSIAFFVITNFVVWAFGTGISGIPYTKNLAGFLECYTVAIPFFVNFTVSTFLSAAAMFYIHEAIGYKKPLAIA